VDFKILDLPYRNVTFKEIFNFNEDDYKKIRKLPSLKTRNKIIIIHTGPVWIMRAWENKKWADLIKKINSSGKYRFIFVGTGKAKKDFEEISKKLDFKVYSLIDKVNIKELMIVLRLSNYLIGVDSGPRNMAHLADLRSITLFGPAASGAIYMPWSKKDIVIDKSNGGGAYEALFYQKKGYIHKITVNEVLEAFKKITKTK
jgi:ADP-heptose:LPS heptosyltransferase